MGKIADTNTRMLITLPKELKKELKEYENKKVALVCMVSMFSFFNYGLT